MSQQSSKQEWLNSQVQSITKLLKSIIFAIAWVGFIIFIIIFTPIYINDYIVNNKAEITIDDETKLALLIIIIPYALFFIVGYSIYKVKNNLLKVDLDKVDTIKIEVIKVRYAIYPSYRYPKVNPYLLIKYRYKDKIYKGYYFPLNQISGSPKELKNKLSKLKRINIYRNTNIIECIEFYDNDYIF